MDMDRIDRELLAALVMDGRATYHELGKTVTLSPNTVADRVKRLRQAGVITGFHAQVDHAALGRALRLLVDVSLREDFSRSVFEDGLAEVPQVISAVHLTGEYDYQLRIVCASTDEFETVMDTLKRQHGVRRLHSRLQLREVPLSPVGSIRQPPTTDSLPFARR